MGQEGEQERHRKLIQAGVGTIRETALPIAEELEEGVFVTEPGVK
jgi:hypothetical protein